MAMARGAAVASALAVNTLDVGATPLLKLRGMSKTSVLMSVIVAAAVTLVVSLSVALGLRATPETNSEQTKNANATGEQVREATVPTDAKAAKVAPKLAPLPAAQPPKPAPAAPKPGPTPVAPPIAETMAVPAPAAPAPDYDPPEYVPPAPAPAYVPPAPPPAYVPPQPQVPAVQPEPRLRDKIIERIPIINRFHDPQPQYPTP